MDALHSPAAREHSHLAREYLRVSVDRSGRARSVDEQHNDHQDDAEANGWTLGAPYADVDVSASRYARKARGEFNQLVADLESDAFRAEILILWENSRGSRKVGEWVDLIDLCERRNVRIWVHTHGQLYDPARPRHRRMLLEDAVDSEYESAKTRERVLRATRATAHAGRPHGKLLYGYARDYDQRGRYVRTVVEPETAAIVREAAERVARGESCYEIARDFNRRAIPTPRAGLNGWDLSQIKRTVTNPGYAAHRVHQGEIIGKADWPSILDEELWSSCVARLNDPRRKTVRDAKVRHLLSGTARCAVCGASMRVQKNRTHFAYVCSERFCVSIETTRGEAFITELVLRRLERDDALGLFTPPGTEETVAVAKRETDELEARLKGFYVLAAAGRISPGGLAEIEDRLLPEIEDAKRRAQPSAVPAVLRSLQGSGARQRWPQLSIGLQREAVHALVDLKVGRTYRGARRLDPWRFEESRWRGSDETWGRIWKRDGRTPGPVPQ